MKDLDIIESFRWRVSRRTFLSRSMAGLGSLALGSLLKPNLFGLQTSEPETAAQWRGIVQPLHFPARANRIIFLTMAGGPSHLETFDYKPKLAEMNGKPMPDSLTKGQQVAQLQGQKLVCLGPQHAFKRCGNSGQEISETLPHIGSIADDICIIRSMYTEQINHDPAHAFLNTGTAIPGRPSMGSWLLYGLGSEAEDLPGFVVLISSGGGQDQPVAARQWHSGFLPSRLQGVQFHSKGEPVLYVQRPPGVNSDDQKAILDTVNDLNRAFDHAVRDPEIATRIAQYEMAFRMQTSVPELMDISKEPQSILDLYGAKPGDGSFASNCLLARRLAERGVRFVQLYHRGWDHHGGVKKGVETTSKLVDQASAALVKDLKARGMFDDTLIVWGGEFGRTPMGQGDGRDHHIKGYSIWMAGAGIQGGMSYGNTDEFGYNAVENTVHVHDLHATILHLFGIDHEKLTYRFQGRDFRLTDVAGNVVKAVLA